MIDFHSLEVIARNRQVELLRAAPHRKPAAVRPERQPHRQALPGAALLSRFGRVLVAIGSRLECLDARPGQARRGCGEASGPGEALPSS